MGGRLGKVGVGILPPLNLKLRLLPDRLGLHILVVTGVTILAGNLTPDYDEELGLLHVNRQRYVWSLEDSQGYLFLFPYLVITEWASADTIGQQGQCKQSLIPFRNEGWGHSGI